MEYDNDLILKAAKGEETDRVPVWLMRQAGRILPEYREIRNNLASFKELVETPELAAEVTIQPVDILGVDAAIIFSDILVIPDAMGLPYTMQKGIGPVFPSKIEKASDIEKLKTINAADDLSYVLKAIDIAKKRLNGRVPIIGFAGAPWTIFSYMLEGSGSKTFSKARKFLYTNPIAAEKLLEKITEATVLYLKAQIKAGVEMVQVFDSWAGILPPNQYKKFGLKYLSQICDAIDEVPITLFSKGAWYAYSDLAKLNCNTIGVDWNTNPKLARQLVGEKRTLQGNLDPCMLYSSDEDIINATKDMLTSFGAQKYIANLGHGVYPDTDPEKVKLFIDTIKNFKF